MRPVHIDYSGQWKEYSCSVFYNSLGRNGQEGDIVRTVEVWAPYYVVVACNISHFYTHHSSSLSVSEFMKMANWVDPRIAGDWRHRNESILSTSYCASLYIVDFLLFRGGSGILRFVVLLALCDLSVLLFFKSEINVSLPALDVCSW